LEARVARGVHALWSLAEEDGLTVRWIEGGLLASFGSPEEMFLNVNTPEELDRARRISDATRRRSPSP
jgi:hypothetical protein